jgi:hypothetical protein
MLTLETIRGLYHRAKAYYDSRAQHDEQRREVLRRRVDHLTARKRGKAPSLLVRPSEMRCRIYPATFDSLLALGHLRCVSPQQVASGILEAVCETWNKYPFDEELLFKRVEDPQEADGSVVVGVTGERSDPMSKEEVLLRMLAYVIFLLTFNGVPPGKISEYFNAILDVEDAEYKKDRDGQD